MATAPQVPIEASPKWLKNHLNWGYISTPIIFYFLVYVLPTSGDHIAGGIGKWVGSMFLPALIAYCVRGRTGDWRGFSRWFFWLGLFLPTLTYYGAHSSH